MRRYRVLVVDDSLFMRAAVKKLLEKEPRLEWIGEAKDGLDAVGKVAQLKPDVVSMDFNMPNLDGAGAVREIMRTHPTPVVMLSAHTRDGAKETFEALAAGAVDFVTKPTGEVSAEMTAVGPQLVAKLVAAAGAAPRALPVSSLPAPGPRLTRSSSSPSLQSPVGGSLLSAAPLHKVVVVGISTGGPAALGNLLPQLPADTSCALVVVQHLPAGFTGPLAERLDGVCAIRVREAKDGDHPRPGLALIAPGDRHLELASDGSVVLRDGPEVNGVRPSADVTMRSAAQVFGRRTVGVIMTGMGRDGAEGIRLIKEAGGATLAQDQASSVIWGMPRAAVETGCVDVVAPLDDLADAIRKA